MSVVLGSAVGCSSQLDPNRTSSSNPNAVHTAVGGPLQVSANTGSMGITRANIKP